VVPSIADADDDGMKDDRVAGREAVRAGSNGMSLLEARGVTKVYRSAAAEVRALDSIDLTVAAGELVAVMGPSGSGKTTLSNCLSGLDDIDHGQVLVEGRDLFATSDAVRTPARRAAAIRPAVAVRVAAD
jgi:putative ABC transport system ATP-binding protein